MNLPGQPAPHPISSYGLIGNMRTAALVSPTGAIEWLCLPFFDSPSIFASILDPAVGGAFTCDVHDGQTPPRQFYIPDTNVLLTHFRGREGAVSVIDFMPTGMPKRDHQTPDLVRIVRPVHGRVDIELCVNPAFDYARAAHGVRMHPAGAVVESDGQALAVASTFRLGARDGRLYARPGAGEDRSGVIALWHRDRDETREPVPITVEAAAELLEHTCRYWRSWVGRSCYSGRWREAVMRSALALKLLTFEPTGAIVAAPTTSLPEHMGGARNWDYRFTWLRDAAFTIYALLRLGYTGEASAFFGWLEQRCHELEDGHMLRPLYSIHGAGHIPEQELPHLRGYGGSRPVRIGNAASGQLQLDAYGALMDAVYLHNQQALPISYDLWVDLRALTDWVCANWRTPDCGIWEVRGPARDFVYSKLMCWVAIDRAMRLASDRSFPCDLDRWRRTRDEVHDTIMAHGWSPRLRSFVQYFGAETLDAANLLMSQVMFLGPADPRVLSTIDAISSPPAAGGLLDDFVVYRYDTGRTDDGVGGPEGGFNMCTFWLIEALTRAGLASPERLEAARLLFERMLGCAGPLGLYPEQTAADGAALGNYPQALTHLSLITSAMRLDRVLGRARPGQRGSTEPGARLH